MFKHPKFTLRKQTNFSDPSTSKQTNRKQEMKELLTDILSLLNDQNFPSNFQGQSNAINQNTIRFSNINQIEK